jgi:2-phospho-L-lactate guanylyltransferase
VQHGLVASVLVPVKGFADAKVRLADALAPAERQRLARFMAAGVIRAAHPLPVVVVCEDAEVSAWAEAEGASVVWTPARGLNAAVEAGVTALAAQGADIVVVCHADLPFVRELASLVGEGVTLAPDRHRDGTNVAVIPARSGFHFSYGPGSFARHLAEAERIGCPAKVIDRADLSWDVDVPDDLVQLLEQAARAAEDAPA